MVGYTGACHYWVNWLDCRQESGVNQAIVRHMVVQYVVDYSNYGFMSSYTGICTCLNVVGPYRLQQESRQAGSSSKYHVCKDESKDP